MEITWAFFVGFTACLYSLLIHQKLLIYLVMFFFSFTATVVLNFNSGQGISLFLMINLFITFIFIISLLRDVANKKVLFSRYSIIPIQFGFLILISILMPIWIDGALEVDSNQIYLDYYKIPIQFSLDTVLNIVPLVLGIILILSILRFVNNEETLFKASKYMFASITFIAFWGAFQFLCNYLPFLDYPDYIFNNIKSETARGFSQTLGLENIDNSFSRLSSVTHEPSTFVKHLLIPLPFLYFSMVTKTYIYNKKFDRFIFLLFIILILLSTSSTGILGLITFYIISLFFLSYFYNRKTGLKLLLSMTGITLLFFLILVLFPNYIQLTLIEKLSSGSGVERFLSVTNSWQYFLMYPIYGVGWNNVTVNDLIVNILVNSGLVGLISFLFLFFISIKWSTQDIKSISANHIDSNSLRLKNHLCGYLVSFITTVILGIFTGVEFYLGYFYVILGMLYASCNIVSKIGLYKKLAGVIK